jgi:peptidoglycan/xylan/chitin deacetylase (PgdA/CDA1 family)
VTLSSYSTLAVRRIRQRTKELKRFAERRRARGATRNGAAVILYYHRIAGPDADPWQTSVSPESFAAQLDALAAEWRVLPLAELIGASRKGRIPDRSVAITFDDGYVDNLRQALPLLERHQQAATFYVATGYIGGPGPYWWDEIADLMVGSGDRPNRLEAQIGKRLVAVPTATMEERREALFGIVNEALKRLSPAKLQSGLEPIRAWAGRTNAEASLSEDPGGETRPMTAKEVAELAASSLTEIGAHTSLHPSLPVLDARAQREEIVASRATIAEICGAAPRSFAYPYGDNDRSARKIVAEAGFDNAVLAESTVPFTTAANPYAIPRIVARNEAGERLSERIATVLSLRGT